MYSALKVRKLGLRPAELKEGQSLGMTLPKDLKEAYKEAADARMDGKLIIMVDWTVDKLISKKPVVWRT